MTIRIAHISDSHLSPTKPAFQPNFEKVVAHVRMAAPDLVISTGDVSLDGAERTEDLAHAKAAHDAIGLPYKALPGNHDVGDDPAIQAQQPADEARHRRYVGVFGEDRFIVDVPGWRVIGMNALITGSSFVAAEAQYGFLIDAALGAEGRSIALFLHKPLFNSSASETEVTYWYVLHGARQRLLAAFGENRPKLVACGHVHQYRNQHAEGMHLVWAPPTSFIVGDAYQETAGSKLLGYLTHDLHPNGKHETKLVTVDGMSLFDIGDMPEIYGQLPRLDAGRAA